MKIAKKKAVRKPKKKPVKRRAAKKKETRGERNCRFIETLCVIPEGKRVGQKVVLCPFQRKFIIEIYDNPHGTDTAILSMARKNAKTALIAFIVILHTVGPEAIRNSRVRSGAMSREQASEVYNLASKSIALSEDMRDLFHIIPSQKKIIGLPYNVEYQAMSADAQTAHGGSPVLTILDEVGQIRGPSSDFVDAMTTADGAYDNPIVFYISTQSANDGDFFSILLDDALKNKPEKTVCHLYTATPECDVMDEKEWAKANPALGHFRSRESILKHAKKAARMPSSENSFRNLILNQRVAVKAAAVTSTVWKMNGGEPLPLHELKNLRAGLDLSSKFDLTAYVIEGDGEDGNVHVHTYAWTPSEKLIDRAKRDRTPYDVWVKKGFLRTTPGFSVDYEYIVRELREIGKEVEIDLSKVPTYFDRWNIEFFRAACQKSGFDMNLQEHGQGFKSMSPAMDAWEADLLNSRARHGMHPVLTMCAGNAVVTKDPAGGRKLDKAKATGRIDCLVAWVMAKTGALGKPQEQEKKYQMFVLG